MNICSETTLCMPNVHQITPDHTRYLYRPKVIGWLFIKLHFPSCLLEPSRDNTHGFHCSNGYVAFSLKPSPSTITSQISPPTINSTYLDFTTLLLLLLLLKYRNMAVSRCLIYSSSKPVHICLTPLFVL